MRSSISVLVVCLASCALSDDAPAPGVGVIRQAGFEHNGFEHNGFEHNGFEHNGFEHNAAVREGHDIESLDLDGPFDQVWIDRGGLAAERGIITGFTASYLGCLVPGSGVTRACGWKRAGTGTCTAASTVVVDTSCTGDPMMRICTGTAPCEYGTPQMLATNDNPALRDHCPRASFTCPASGHYAVLIAAANTAAPSYTVTFSASAGVFQPWEKLLGPELIGAHFQSRPDGGTPVDFRIANIREEIAAYDTPGAKNTYLYDIQVATDAGYVRACKVRPEDGLEPDAGYAIPIAAVWDYTGLRTTPAGKFSFACTPGVIAKCYRWGYKTWKSHPAGATEIGRMHNICTRVAMADYCGDGVPHTVGGTLINVWDALNPHIQSRALDAGLNFEAGWDEYGAVCLSKKRWESTDVVYCPRLTSPDCREDAGRAGCHPSLCNDELPNQDTGEEGAVDFGADMFNESAINP